jgi:putative PEP-CTERM system histidine kinase
MDYAGLISYSFSGLVFIFLFTLMAIKWRGGRQATILIFAILITSIWAAVFALNSIWPISNFLVFTLEMIKIALWILFLYVLLENTGKPVWYLFGWIIIFVWTGFLVLGNLLSIEFVGLFKINAVVDIFGLLIFSLLGIVIIEQYFRNSPINRRWAIKHMCVGIGGMFAYDIFLYSEALLFRKVNLDLWNARGLITAFLAPMIAISAVRNPQWSVVPFVSRHFVFYSTSLISAGIYLFLMALAGYYIKQQSGEWGTITQIVFFVGAILVLLVVMFSGQVRARYKKFLSEHFYSNKYDYREEWLRITQILSATNTGKTIYQRVLEGVAQIVYSSAGILWIKKETDIYYAISAWNMHAPEKDILGEDIEFIHAIEKEQRVIDIVEYIKNPKKHKNISIPKWITSMPDAWLIVPIIHENSLYGIILLAKSITSATHTWEDSELLLTVGQQVSSYMLQYETTQKLIEANKFEAFNRLSAFVVHDLKNVVAQLNMIVVNAKKFKDNPVFIEDAFLTIDNAVSKMNRMLNQLQKKETCAENKKIQIKKILENVLLMRSSDIPVPILDSKINDLCVTTNGDQLTSILEHLVKNAQEATPSEGEVILSIERQKAMALIIIKDTGSGMDRDFIRDRLFKPFDTTKGNAGMGIGAYESREFIKDAGGHLDVDSVVGQGTTIKIYLPLSNG